jgi:CubicO group peptidase (beta-lactamase class C family)
MTKFRQIDEKIDTTMSQALLKGYENGVYTGASAGFMWQEFDNDPSHTVFYGNTGHGCQDLINQNTYFDLASLTKPLVTLLCLLILIEKKSIQWSTPISACLPVNNTSLLREKTVFDLAAHLSGLPAHRNFWDCFDTNTDNKQYTLIKHIEAEPLQSGQPLPLIYSDLGYILLGYLIECITAQSLAVYWRNTVAAPLDLGNALHFSDPSTDPDNYVCTGQCPYTGIVLSGVVHDDNCRAMGGVGGHAGLFGTVEGVLRICKEMIKLYYGKKSALPIATDVFRRICTRINGFDWCTGLMLPSLDSPSCGQHFHKQSIGHLGFTGTSFWVDLSKKAVVVLLTNRVIKGDDLSGIRRFRPTLHDAVMSALLR